MASQTFFLGAVFRCFNISFTGPGNGVAAFFPGIINSCVTIGATFGLRSLQKVLFANKLKGRFWNPFKLFVDEKIGDGDSGNGEICYSSEEVSHSSRKIHSVVDSQTGGKHEKTKVKSLTVFFCLTSVDLFAAGVAR